MERRCRGHTRSQTIRRGERVIAIGAEVHHDPVNRRDPEPVCRCNRSRCDRAAGVHNRRDVVDIDIRIIREKIARHRGGRIFCRGDCVRRSQDRIVDTGDSDRNRGRIRATIPITDRVGKAVDRSLARRQFIEPSGGRGEVIEQLPIGLQRHLSAPIGSDDTGRRADGCRSTNRLRPIRQIRQRSYAERVIFGIAVCRADAQHVEGRRERSLGHTKGIIDGNRAVVRCRDRDRNGLLLGGSPITIRQIERDLARCNGRGVGGGIA